MNFRNRAIIGLSSLLLFTLSHRAFAVSPAQEQMNNTLHWVESMFYASYAPAKWKEGQFGWNLNVEVARIESKIQDGSILTVKQFHSAILDLINSTRDYHVGINFYAREKASLPFQIKGVGDRFFFAFIDRDRLPIANFPFSEGDELTRADGRPMLEAIQELERFQSAGNPKTQRALAEISFSSRQASRGIPVPNGKITLEIKRNSEPNPRNHELTWVYTPESIAFLTENTDSLLGSFDGRVDSFVDPRTASIKRLFDRQMTNSAAANLNPNAGENRYAIGAPKSYVPELGTKIFEFDRGFFHSRIFRTENGKLVGLVRIPSYGGGANQAREFQQIIKLMEEKTDALVIDQVRNPGGSVPFLYSLASMLTDRALIAPYHKIALTPADVIDAENTLEMVSLIRDDSTARASIGETIGGYPVTLALAQRLGEYSRFLLSEWRAGRRLTNPFYLVGVDKIEPSVQVNYSKKILVLVDELDFSGGDFFPAIMQDNGRAKIMGTRTAGAGGFVTSVSAPNLFGIESISLTGSIAERVNREPIENLGVTPDLNYQLSIADLRSGGSEFREAILRALQ